MFSVYNNYLQFASSFWLLLYCILIPYFYSNQREVFKGQIGLFLMLKIFSDFLVHMVQKQTFPEKGFYSLPGPSH